MGQIALFINKADFVRKTSINGNVDPDKYLQFVEIAQDIEIQGYLGTDLYDKIFADIIADTLSGDYLILRDKYISPLLTYLSMSTYLTVADVNVSNGGVFKHSAENSVQAENERIAGLKGQYDRWVDYYTSRLLDYLCNQSSLFPEYSTNTDEDIRPNRTLNPTGWYLGDDTEDILRIRRLEL